MNPGKLYERISSNPRNVDFRDLIRVLEAFGYRLDRVNGSHRIYRHPLCRDKLNLQPDGKNAKPYQVRQFLDAVREHNLQLPSGEP